MTDETTTTEPPTPTPPTAPRVPGTIGLICGDLSRYTLANFDLMALQAPAHTAKMGGIGVGIAINLNNCVKGLEGDWLWVMGDDHRFSSDVLLRLLARLEERPAIDILAPLVTSRRPPIMPVLYGPGTDAGHYRRFDWADVRPDADGLMEVHAAGNAGMLIRRRVFEAIAALPLSTSKPGGPYVWKQGQTTPEQNGEDLWFCEEARACGFKIHVDTTVHIGHMSPITYWPRTKPDGTFGCEIDLGEGVRIPLEFRVQRQPLPTEPAAWPRPHVPAAMAEAMAERA